jgi:hypothetical protein
MQGSGTGGKRQEAIFQPRKSPPSARFANGDPQVDLVAIPAVSTLRLVFLTLSGVEIALGARKRFGLAKKERLLSEVRAAMPK